MGRWQRFISRLFPQETDLIAAIDANEEGNALTVTLAVPSHTPNMQATPVSSLDLERGRISTVEGDHVLSTQARAMINKIVTPETTQQTSRQRRIRGTIQIAENQLPNTLQALRSLQTADNAPQIIEQANAQAIKLADKRPLQYEFQVDFPDPDNLSVVPHIVSADGKVRIEPQAINQDSTDAWVRQGKTYYPLPAKIPAEIAPYIHHEVTLQGDDIPFFLAKQIRQLRRNGTVIVSDTAAQAQISADIVEPRSILEMDDTGWITVHIAYRADVETFTSEDLAAIPDDAQFIRRGMQWYPIDRTTEQRLKGTFDQIERKLTAQRDATGITIAPGNGDEARRMLLDVAEIDEGVAFQKFLSGLGEFREIDAIDPPQGLFASLRPYQVEGYRWLAFLRKYYLNGILADDMGLGKTVTVLALLQYVLENPVAEHPLPSLIVCPTSCVDTWIDESQKFTPNLTIARFVGTDRDHTRIAQSQIVITTYETLRREMKTLVRRPWDYVILDEAQKIKNPITDTARACRILLSHHRLAVTGTPIENHLRELWALFDFLMPGYLGSKARFRREYENPIARDKSIGASEELKRKIAPFVMRRMKEQVAQDLPPKLYVTRECRLSREQSRLYEDIAIEGRERVLEQARKQGNKVTMTMSILASLTHLKQICCHPALLEPNPAQAQLHKRSGKFEEFKEVLAERLAVGDKVLVFSQYAEMCKIIERYLTEEDIPHLYLDGQTRNRQELVRAFQSDSSIKVFVLSLRAAGFGITLTAASSVIHYDRWWNPAVENQATDRAYRIGQKRSVQVVQFRTEETIEEKIDTMLVSKSELFGDIIETDLAGKIIERDELLELFTYSPLHEQSTEDGIPVIPADEEDAAAMAL